MPLSGAASAALSTPEFSDLLRAAGPYPDNAAVAVAVSGGADSMTLLSLAADWAADRGAGAETTLTALTVDHGLRADSAAEAAGVAAWCRGRGIAHHTLSWDGDKPEKGLQAAARTARYALLEDWCRAHGHTELLVAHTENDQAETFLMRMSRGSGLDGLAAMPLVSERHGVRLIRPLLGVSRSRIEATAAARSLEPVSDPSNLDRRYARVRMRERLRLLEAHGVSAAAIAGTARIFGQMRAARERETAALADEIAVLHSEGYATIARAGLASADIEIAGRLVSAVLISVGGLDYGPRRARLDRLMADIRENRDFRPRTLGNCVIHVRGADIQIRREHRTVGDDSLLAPGQQILWDGRFEIGFSDAPGLCAAGYRLGALGEDGWRQIVARSGDEDLRAYRGIPGPVRYALPAIRHDEKVVEVPQLGYQSRQGVEKIVETCRFQPRSPLNGHPFWVV